MLLFEYGTGFQNNLCSVTSLEDFLLNLCTFVYNTLELFQKFNKESILQEFALCTDEKVIALYKRPYPFFWHEKYCDERNFQQPESPEGIQIRKLSSKLSCQCQLSSHTVLDGCMVLTNHALYKCRPRYGSVLSICVLIKSLCKKFMEK